MIDLLKKEFILAMHPTNLIFLCFSAMLLIPNYPYYVIFFYTGLAIFFTCLTGRENNDVFYTMTLPVAKKNIVKARISFVVIIQLLQVLICIPFMILKQNLSSAGNQAGMDANIAFLGLALVLCGIYNLVFFSKYYKDVNKVGQAFIVSSTVVFLYILIAEACVFVIPFFKNYLDTANNMYTGYKLIVLIAGIAIYALLTFLSYKKSVKNFEKQDL